VATGRGIASGGEVALTSAQRATTKQVEAAAGAGDVQLAGAQILGIFAARLDKEHELIGQRMGWSMTLNGLLLAAVGVLVGSASVATVTTLWATAAVGLTGALSNLSILYSNVWGQRAITAADRALDAEMARGTGELDSVQLPYRRLMRLYGRDPESHPPRSRQSQSRRTRLLHPWFLMPALFAGVFTFLPSGAYAITTVGHGPGVAAGISVACAVPPLVAVAMFRVFRSRDRSTAPRGEEPIAASATRE
jgi:hypothetical protein